MITADFPADIDYWFREHPRDYPCQAEAALQPSLEPLRISRSQSELLSPHNRGMGCSSLLRQVEEWQAEWTDPNCREVPINAVLRSAASKDSNTATQHAFVLLT